MDEYKSLGESVARDNVSFNSYLSTNNLSGFTPAGSLTRMPDDLISTSVFSIEDLGLVTHPLGCGCMNCGLNEERHDNTGEGPAATFNSGLQAGSLQDLADYLREGFWEDVNWQSQNFNVSGSGPNANNGEILYNVSGFDLSGSFGRADGNGLSEERKELVRDSFQLFEEVLGIKFTETTSQNQNTVDIFFSDNSNGAFAGTWVDPASGTSSISFINIDSDWSGGTSTYDDYTLQTIMHEIGHALGLGHQGHYNGSGNFGVDADFANDSWQASMMSYFSQDENPNVDADREFLQTPMAVDWLALQDIYGGQSYGGKTFGVQNAFQGDTVYGFNTNITDDVSRIWADFSDYAHKTASTIVDGGGNDTLDLSGYSANQRIDLTPSSANATQPVTSDVGGRTGNLTMAVGTVIENAVTGSGNDTITGNAADNLLVANAGNDTIYGGSGDDTIDGGSGQDTLILNGNFNQFSVFETSAAQWSITQSGIWSADVFSVETLVFQDRIVQASVGDPLATAFDFNLLVGVAETGSYGRGFNGQSDPDGIVTGTFTGASGDLVLSLDTFDIDFVDEVAVLLNGQNIGYLDPTGNNGSGQSTFEIDAGSYLAGENVLTFLNSSPTHVWGITDILIEQVHGIDFDLQMGAVETGNYGRGFLGTSDPDGVVQARFTGTSGDLVLSLDTYDIDFVDEVAVLLNGDIIGYLDQTGNNGTGQSTFEIDAGSYLAGENILTFQNSSPNHVWGITDILIEPVETIDFDLQIGVAENGNYGRGFMGTSDPDGVVGARFTGTSGDLVLSLDTYDIDFVDEVAVLLNGQNIGYLDQTGNNGTGQSTFEIDAGSYLAGENVLTFLNSSPTHIWGITDILLEPAETIDFELQIGVAETGAFGREFSGQRDDDGVVTGRFMGGSGDLVLSLDTFDIDFVDEVAVLLNGDIIGYLDQTANNGFGQSSFEIDAGSYLAGENILTFQNSSPNHVWGITDILLEPAETIDFDLQIGVAETGNYGRGFMGTSDPDGVVEARFTGGSGDLVLSLDTYDIDFVDEVAVLLNGDIIGYLDQTGNNGTGQSSFEIDAGSYLAGENVLTFLNSSPTHIWGITDILIEPAPQSTFAGDFDLQVGVTETGEFGNNFNGTRDPDDLVSGRFMGTSGDLELTVRGFDVDRSDEVAVLLNGEVLGYLNRTENNETGQSGFRIEEGTYLQGENELAFQNTYTGWNWGVTDILVKPVPKLDFDLGLGEIERGEFGNNFNGTIDADGLVSGRFTATSGDLELTVTGFDIDRSDEVAVLLNGEVLGYLDRTSNNGTKENSFVIEEGTYLQGDNELAFQNTYTNWNWGVTDLMIDPV